MKIDGGCHCGQLKYEAEIDPSRVEVCHCTDCQTLSGSAFRTVVPAIEGSFRFLAGTPKTYLKTAESGARRAQVFCPECGTSIYSAPAGEGSARAFIRVGTARQRSELRPQAQYWCRSAQDWVKDLPSIRKVATQ